MDRGTGSHGTGGANGRGTTRRGLLAAGLGGAAGWVAGVPARPHRAPPVPAAPSRVGVRGVGLDAGVMGEGGGPGSYAVLGKNPGRTAFRCDATGPGGVGTA